MGECVKNESLVSGMSNCVFIVCLVDRVDSIDERL